MKNSVTITSGIFRGRKIITPDNGLTHPMGSREKLALFNALISAGASFASDTAILDYCAGSGALGLEAVSRGAKQVVFVDKNSKARSIIRQNLVLLGIEGVVLPALPPHSASKSLQLFDLIIADPPYNALPTELSDLKELLKPNGLLALSHPASVNPTDIFSDLELITTKSHSSSRISIFRKSNY